MKSRNIAVATYATKRYAYAIPNFARRLVASIIHAKQKSGTIIFVTDTSTVMSEVINKHLVQYLPEHWEVKICPIDVRDDNLKNYKEEAQLLIAQMQSHAFSVARAMDVDYLWSVEADVLVAHNSLDVSLNILDFDQGYYDVAMCSYPSQGGGAFLGGRGDYFHHIAEDFTIDEKEVPEEILKEIEDRKEKCKAEGFEATEEWIERDNQINEEIKKCPPKGNVFEANAKNWRRRGWMEYAYPAIGKGAILPTDWVGLGCTLMSRKALSMAHFDGYEGKGTQDLYMGWNYWKPNDIKMCVTTHSICDHVIRRRDGEEQLWEDFVHVRAYHEIEGECEGHLRQRHIPFYTHVAGEKVKEVVTKESPDSQ